MTLATTSGQTAACRDRHVCGRRMSALCAAAAATDVGGAIDCDPAFVILLSDALKPDDQETFHDLRRRGGRYGVSDAARTAGDGGRSREGLQAGDLLQGALMETARLPLCDLRPWSGMNGLPRDWYHGKA